MNDRTSSRQGERIDHEVETAGGRYQPSSRIGSKGELSFPRNLLPSSPSSRVGPFEPRSGTRDGEEGDETKGEWNVYSCPFHPPHVSFHYVPEPQAEDGNTGGTNRE